MTLYKKPEIYTEKRSKGLRSEYPTELEILNLSKILPKFPSCSAVNIRNGKVLHSEVSRTLFGECKNIPSALFASSKQSDSQLKGKICTVS